MIKKLTYVLMLSLGFSTAQASEVIEVTDAASVAPASVTTTSELKEPDLFEQEQRAGALAWVKEHKALTLALVATLVGTAAVAGTLYYSPEIRKSTVDTLSKAKDGVVAGAQTGWTYCVNNKQYAIPAAVLSLIMLSLTTYDLCHDTQDSYIKSFANWLVGNKEEPAAIE